MPPYIVIPFILFLVFGLTALFAFRRLDSRLSELTTRLDTVNWDLSSHRSHAISRIERTAGDLTVLSDRVSGARSRLEELAQWRQTAELDFRKATTLMARVAELEHKETSSFDREAHRRIDGLVCDRGVVRQRLEVLERSGVGRKAPQTATEVLSEQDRISSLELRVSGLESLSQKVGIRRHSTDWPPAVPVFGPTPLDPGSWPPGTIVCGSVPSTGDTNAAMTPP